MMTKQEAIQLQVSLQEQIQKSGVNLIECSGCNAVVFHRTATTQEWQNGIPETAQCPHCDTVNFAEDCPDVYYDGMQNNREFQVKPKPYQS